MTAYLPCLGGIIAVRAARSPASLRLLWSSGAGGGPPVVAAGLVWTIGPDGTLYGLDPGTGAVRQRASVGTSANHFPTPAVADGLLLAPSAERVVAFTAAASAAPAGPTAPAAAGPTPGAAGQPASAGRAGVRAGVIVAVAIGCLVVIGAIGWMAGQRRARGGR